MLMTRGRGPRAPDRAHAPPPTFAPAVRSRPVLRSSRSLRAFLHAAAPIAVALALAVSAAPASAQSATLPHLGAGRVAAQIGTGVLGGPIGYVGGGLATRFLVRRFGGSQGTASTAAERGAYVGIAAVTAVGPTLIGARGAGHGLYVASLGGATVGMLGSALVARLNRTSDDRPAPPCGFTCRVSAVAAFTLPSIGATLGYNVSRRR